MQSLTLSRPLPPVDFRIADAEQAKLTPAREHLAGQDFILFRRHDELLMLRLAQAPDGVAHGDMLFGEGEIHFVRYRE